MAAIDVRTKTDQIVARIETPGFLEQLKEMLPENVTLAKFKRVAITAVRTNADLANADQTSLFSSIIRCAQDGLLPDGKQAALVPYKGKVSYLPMIEGIRAKAAEFGWAIRTAVVYANDEFDYTDEPPSILHRPVRPGAERGELLAAWAVARHRDGRRMQAVLHPADIAKRRAVAQTDQVWKQWPEAMWEKSAGHDLFKQLPLGSIDASVSRLLTEGVIVDAEEALYGPDLRTGPESPTDDTHSGAGTSPLENGVKQEGAATDDGSAQAASSPDIEDGEWEEAAEPPSPEVVQATGDQTIPGGVYKGETLASVAATDAGAQWLLTQLRRLAPGDRMRPAIETYVEGALPETWAAYQAWRMEQAA